MTYEEEKEVLRKMGMPDSFPIEWICDLRRGKSFGVRDRFWLLEYLTESRDWLDHIIDDCNKRSMYGHEKGLKSISKQIRKLINES